ncbi:hypothetical protein L0128_22780 [candidate division KSB1 bacterium]|nr:hypothetical protein [candidate division KSB1 bacterium]
MEPDEVRIAEILGTKAVPEVTQKRLLKYRQYLLEQLDQNELLTGCEDFPWEEEYVFDPASHAEYAALKQTHPSYTDEFELLDILADKIPEDDLVARVKRRSDGMIFEIGLSWLTARKTNSKNYQLLDDFATWVLNW